MTEQLIISNTDGVGGIVLNQPEKHNAISFEMWVGIREAIADFAADPSVRVVVLEGAGGKAFSAGADISQFESKRGSKADIAIYNNAVNDAQMALIHIEKPTIAKIRGYCIGGGLGTALGCDLRIASDDAKFGIPAARLGLGYGLPALKPLVQLVGPSTAKEILFTAKRFNAQEAQGMGLINRAVGVDELDAFVEDYANTIASNAPLTIKAAKHTVAQSLADEATCDEALCQRLVDACFASEDYREGRTAFKEKRQPAFRGR